MLSIIYKNNNIIDRDKHYIPFLITLSTIYTEGRCGLDNPYPRNIILFLNFKNNSVESYYSEEPTITGIGFKFEFKIIEEQKGVKLLVLPQYMNDENKLVDLCPCAIEIKKEEFEAIQNTTNFRGLEESNKLTRRKE